MTHSGLQTILSPQLQCDEGYRIQNLPETEHEAPLRYAPLL